MQAFDPGSVRAEIARRGMDCQEVAKQAGLGYRAVRDAANGERDPKAGTLCRIANVLGVSVASFFVEA